MEKFQPVCRDRNWTRVKNETCAHCFDTQRMNTIDIFVSEAGWIFHVGKFPSRVPRSRQYINEISSPPAHLKRNQILYWNWGLGKAGQRAPDEQALNSLRASQFKEKCDSIHTPSFSKDLKDCSRILNLTCK